MVVNWKNVDWEDYEKRVRELEDEGLTRSDAQGVVDAELMTAAAATKQITDQP
jgi:hypothetical protein